MNVIGMIGGMSWESSATYYRLINERVKQRLGGFHSAHCVLYSVDFADIERLQQQGRWDEAGLLLAHAARCVEQAGADMLVLCTNTMHCLADTIQQAVTVPLLHIADATAMAVQAQGLQRVGLLGTRFTMEGDFYTGRLREQHGLQVLLAASNVMVLRLWSAPFP
ncbi:MAG: amino acid racemase [Chloroflexaceae bacterium]|nr:amino acid racemase [Chloroflexaceae bacterium]